MARYPDKDEWVEEILIPDRSTPILGGQPVWEVDRLVDGFANVSAGQLADRTRHLKNKVEQIESDLDNDFSSFMRREENLLDLDDIGQAKYNLELNLVDNTRDLDKPISVLQQEALDTKVNLSDPRLTDEREWIAEEVSQSEAEEGTSTTNRKWSAQRVRQAILGWWNGSSDKTKLDGIQAGATVNSSDAQLRNRATHTGTQPISSVTGLQGELDGKVDSIEGYGLSQENYTPAEKDKLSSLEGSKFKGEYVSLSALQAAHPSPEVGSYAYVDAGVGELVTKYIWDSSDESWVGQQGETTAITPAEVKSLYESNPDTNAFSDSEQSKLEGVQVGATANATNAQLRDRATHTGTQPISSVTNLQTTLDNKAPVSHTHTASQISDSSEVGRGVITASSPLIARTALELGNVDNTRDEDKTVYAFRISDTRAVVSIPEDIPERVGLFEFKLNTSVGNPPKPSSGTYAHVMSTNGWTADGSGGWPTQVSWGEAISFRKGTSATTWGAWNELISTDTVLTATGQSTLYPMTQKAVTDALDSKKDASWQPTNGSKAQILSGVANAFVSGSSYVNTITWQTQPASSGTLTLNLDTSLNWIVNVSGNFTFAAPSNADPGKTGDIVINVSGDRVVSWSTEWMFLSSVPNIGDDGSTWVISYKVLSATEILASANKVA